MQTRPFVALLTHVCGSGLQFDVTKVGKHNFGGVTIEVSASIM